MLAMISLDHLLAEARQGGFDREGGSLHEAPGSQPRPVVAEGCDDA